MGTKSDYRDNLIVNLGKIRSVKRLPARAIATKLGVKPNTIYAWEYGDTNPTAVNLFLWCKCLGVSIGSMFKPIPYINIDPSTKMTDYTRYKDSYSKNLGANMRKIRKEKYVSGDMVGLALDVHARTIYNWERGTSSPTAVQLYTWCKFMGVDIDKMFIKGWV